MPIGLHRRAFLAGFGVLLAGGGAALARVADPQRVTRVSIEHLRPSQGAVGMREVALKVAEVERRARKPDKLAVFLAKEALPVIKGPGGGLHLIDHHHLARALWEARQREVLVEVVADLSNLPPATFFAEMEERGWLHPFDAEGRRLGPENLPGHVKDMGDDVYRALAGAVRKAGGYGKSQVPFAEFKWADFFRGRIQRALVSKDFDAAVKQALRLAAGADAAGLPGYLGVTRKAA